MTLLVGMTGKARAGKSEVPKVLRHFNSFSNISTLAIGDHVKRVTSVMYGIPLGKFYNAKSEMSERWGITYRDMLQKVGTEFGRVVGGEDFWLKKLEPDYLACINRERTRNIFITDVRYDNEALWIIKRGGFVLEILRDQESDLTEDEKNHKSEAGVSKEYIAAVIDNNKSKKDLATCAVVAIKEVLRKHKNLDK